MADLAADLGCGFRMDEIGDPPPRCLMLGRVEAGTARRDAALCGHAGHLGEDQTRAALGAFAVMDQVPVGRAAFARLVLRHGRDDDAIPQRHAAQAEGGKDRRPARLAAGLLLEPVLGLAHPIGVAQAQVLMADALAAGQQGIGELDRVQVQVTLDLLEPFQAVAGRRLQAQQLDPAFLLITLKGAGQVGLGVQVVRQSNGAVERQPRPRPDREMPRRRRIAHQHHVFMIPTVADDAGKVHPDGRAAQMRRVRHQVMPAQMIRKDRAAGLDDLLLGHGLETHRVPGLLRAFHDEGRGVGVEGIDMRPEPALGRLFEDEGEGVVEFLFRAKPDELAAAHVDVGAEDLGIFAADAAVQPVAGHDQIVVAAVAFGGVEFGAELEVNAQFARALLQQDQQLPPPDARKTVSPRHLPVPVADDRDVVPIDEVVADRLRRGRVVAFQPRQGVVGQHHAPAKGVARAVAFQHGHVMRRIAQLHRDREIEARRPAAQTENLHPVPPPAMQAGTGPKSFQA